MSRRPVARLTLALCCAAVLAACGGGGGSDDPPVAPSTQPDPPVEPQVSYPEAGTLVVNASTGVLTPGTYSLPVTSFTAYKPGNVTGRTAGIEFRLTYLSNEAFAVSVPDGDFEYGCATSAYASSQGVNLPQCPAGILLDSQNRTLKFSNVVLGDPSPGASGRTIRLSAHVSWPELGDEDPLIFPEEGKIEVLEGTPDTDAGVHDTELQGDLFLLPGGQAMQIILLGEQSYAFYFEDLAGDYVCGTEDASEALGVPLPPCTGNVVINAETRSVRFADLVLPDTDDDTPGTAITLSGHLVLPEPGAP